MVESPSLYIKEMLELSFKSQMFDKEKLTGLNLYVPKDYMIRSGLFSLLGPDLNNYDLWADLQKITSPSLVIYGQSELGGEMHGRYIASTFPKGQYNTTPNSGHFPFIESPSEYFDQIRKFLK